VLAGSGVLLKVAPGVVLLPALAAGEDGWGPFRRRCTCGFLATLAVGVGAWLLAGGPNVVRMLTYHAERGVEIGSIYAGLLMVAARARGAPLAVESLYRGVEVQTPWSATAGALGYPLQAAALLVTTWRALRTGRDEPLRYAGAAVLALVAFGKVLSPQDVIWLIPFLACVRGRAGTWGRRIFLLACIATTFLFPVGFAALLRLLGWAIGLLNLRNALLVGLWVLLTFGPPARLVPPPAASGRRGSGDSGITPPLRR
jgi:hypothetical protein